MKTAGFVVLVAALACAALVAQNGARSADGDWPMYSHDPAGTRFSPLTQINIDNVSTLTQAWSVRVTPPAGRGRGARGAAPADPPASTAQAAVPAQADGRGRGAAADPPESTGSNPEATPLGVNRIMYLPSQGNRILALDAETGKELWR